MVLIIRNLVGDPKFAREHARKPGLTRVISLSFKNGTTKTIGENKILHVESDELTLESGRALAARVRDEGAVVTRARGPQTTVRVSDLREMFPPALVVPEVAVGAAVINLPAIQNLDLQPEGAPEELVAEATPEVEPAAEVTPSADVSAEEGPEDPVIPADEEPDWEVLTVATLRAKITELGGSPGKLAKNELVALASSLWAKR
ncbi:hypothetical protein EBT31_07625 [bacterium]|nr:hypothetical protein [bacterium]